VSKTLDELDKLAAEKIMHFDAYAEGCYAPDGWRPTINIEQAFELLEKVGQGKERDYVICNTESNGNTGWRVHLHHSDATYSASEFTAPYAITCACLKAVGVEL
jgi:hypothetical protein